MKPADEARVVALRILSDARRHGRVLHEDSLQLARLVLRLVTK